MWYRIKKFSFLSQTPSDDGADAGSVPKDSIGKLLEKSADDEWLKLFVRTKSFAMFEGWLRADRCEECDPPPRPELNLPAFLKACISAEIWINSRPKTPPDFVVGDYLIALAKIESILRNSAELRSDSDGIGPFQITSADWKRFIASGDAGVFEENDRDDYMDQCYGAAWLAQSDTRELSRQLQAEVQEAQDPEGEAYVPSLSDVFVAHIVGVPAAVSFRKAEMAGDGGRKVDEILIDHVGGESGEEKRQAVEALLRRRHHFLKESAEQSRTVDGMYAYADDRLGRELKFAFALMEEHIPEDIPRAASEGERQDGAGDGAGAAGAGAGSGSGSTGSSGRSAPAWFAEALVQQERWNSPSMKETSAAGKRAILEYFAATDLRTSKVLHWCGAFAAFCLARAGLGKTVIPGAALAANWRKWGNTNIPLATGNIPPGAVIVLSPSPGSSSSGHVGFYSRHLPGAPAQVELLGGNQSDTVRLSNYAASRIVAIRWHDEQMPPETRLPRDGARDTRFGVLLDLIAKHESGGNYNARFGKAGNTNPDFTSMKVKDVLAWQREFLSRGSPSSAVGRYQIIKDTMISLIQDMRLSGNERFDKAMQDRMAMHLLKRRKLDKFLARQIGLVDFGKFLAQEWASLPVLKRTRGHKRRVERGQSYYAGDGLNAAHHKPEDVERVLQALL